MTTMTYTGRLVVESCPTCGTSHAFPEMLYEQAQKKRLTIYCPVGHGWHYTGETEAQKLKRQLQWAQDQAVSERARADGAEASLRTTKGHVTRLRKQVLAGECPFCGQHLRDLDRHVGRMHPDEKAED